MTYKNWKTRVYEASVKGSPLLIYYADKLVVMGNSKNLLKSRKFDAREIYMFYSR